MLLLLLFVSAAVVITANAPVEVVTDAATVVESVVAVLFVDLFSCHFCCSCMSIRGKRVVKKEALHLKLYDPNILGEQIVIIHKKNR